MKICAVADIRNTFYTFFILRINLFFIDTINLCYCSTTQKAEYISQIVLSKSNGYILKVILICKI